MRIKHTHFFICLFAFCLLFSYKLFAEKEAYTRNISILLEENSTGALLEVKGPYSIENPYDGSRVSSGIIGKRYLIRPDANGIRWGEQFPGFHQIKINPKSDDTSILLNGIQYEGSIVIYKIGDTINIINEISIENYLKSILSQQFPHALEQEVMNAVAIAARTTAFFQKNTFSDAFWHVKAADIGYQGRALSIKKSPIAKAVDATSDLIMVYAHENKNIPFIATWTEHSGGKTASYPSIFRKKIPSPSGVKVAHAALHRKETKWSFSFPKQKLAEKLRLKNILSIDLFMDANSGKTYAVRIKDEKGNHDLDFFSFQKIIGKNQLQSTDFKVDLQNQNIVITGFGQGSGVGLCLHGATAMAQNGELAVNILSTFFPNTYLLNLSAMPTNAEN